MKIYIGADHNGFEAKKNLINFLRNAGYEVLDVGNNIYDPEDDFPVFAQKATTKLLNGDGSDRAILICGGGQGMAMAANRNKGVRASVVFDKEEARLTRNDNDSNVLALPARLIQKDPIIAEEIVSVWLNTPFANEERYKRRNNQLDK